jgi:L-rhamnose isomerase/sugar isomerase
MDIIDAEQCLRDAFFTDVRPTLADWRKKKNLDANPLAAYRSSGYEAKVARDREASRAARGASASGSYA